MISWYESGVKNKKIVMPGEGFDSWDYEGLACHFYKKYANKDISKQIKEFEKVISEIMDFVEVESENGNLNKEGVWSWCTLASGKKWPLSKWVQVNTVAPFKRATTLIRKFNKLNSV